MLICEYFPHSFRNEDLLYELDFICKSCFVSSCVRVPITRIVNYYDISTSMCAFLKLLSIVNVKIDLQIIKARSHEYININVSILILI